MDQQCDQDQYELNEDPRQALPCSTGRFLQVTPPATSVAPSQSARPWLLRPLYGPYGRFHEPLLECWTFLHIRLDRMKVCQCP